MENKYVHTNGFNLKEIVNAKYGDQFDSVGKRFALFSVDYFNAGVSADFVDFAELEKHEELLKLFWLLKDLSENNDRVRCIGQEGTVDIGIFSEISRKYVSILRRLTTNFITSLEDAHIQHIHVQFKYEKSIETNY